MVKEEDEEEEKGFGRTLSGRPISSQARTLSKGTSSTPSSDTFNEKRFVNVRILINVQNDLLRNEILNSLSRLRE